MTVSSLNFLQELLFLQKKEEKVQGRDHSRIAATEELEQEEFHSVDGEASAVVAAKEERVEKETGRDADTVPLAQGIHPLHSKLRSRHQQLNTYRILARARKEAKGRKAPKERGARGSPTRAARARVCATFSKKQGVAPELIVALPTPVEGARWLDPADNHTGALLPIMKK